MRPRPPAGRLQVKRFRRNGPRFGALTGGRRGRKPSRRRHPWRRSTSWPLTALSPSPSPTPRQRHAHDHGKALRRAGRGRAGRGVRRHRHQPALRLARDVPARHQHGADARARAGRAVDAVLGGDAHRHHQVRHPDHARRQQGRRRRAGAGDAGHPRAERQGPHDPARHHPAGRDRAGAVLRRRHHHAGHLGDERRRGPVGGGAGLRRPSSCRWRWSSWSALFLLQARGTADVGRLFGPVMLRVVRRAGRARRLADRQEPGRAAGDQSALRHRPDRRPGARHLLGLRLDRAGRHRRRGALRRHGPFRPQADPHRLARPRHAGPAAQLLRPGRADHRRSRRIVRQVFFELVPKDYIIGAGGARRPWPPSSPRRPSSPACSR